MIDSKALLACYVITHAASGVDQAFKILREDRRGSSSGEVGVGYLPSRGFETSRLVSEWRAGPEKIRLYSGPNRDSVPATIKAALKTFAQKENFETYEGKKHRIPDLPHELLITFFENGAEIAIELVVYTGRPDARHILKPRKDAYVNPLDPLHYMLNIVGEEGSEIAKEVNKALRFGLNTRCAPNFESNLEKLQAEITDFIGALQMLNAELTLRNLPTLRTDDTVGHLAKRQRVLTYALHSYRAGVLTKPLAGTHISEWE